ncbi:hypothetical protein VX159_01030 [Dechloromonas sp. ZY10]|uniref:hypothetical protein n=1 Tax=Dechloromonas aquae TaxID=2664436 RepID=UPI0035285695
MFSIIVALLLLAAGVAAIYLILKKMTEEGIDIAAPGSCRRGLCGKPGSSACGQPEPVAEEAPPGGGPRAG